MNLIIDSGNTAIKVACFKDDLLLRQQSFLITDTDQLPDFIKQYNYDAVIFSAVSDVPEAVKNILPSFTKCIFLNASTALPFKNNYHSPATLGTDRIANAAGAHKMFYGSDCLVIDAGTCLKFDFIDSNGIYYGGSISPGLEMRYKALHEFTGKLPLLTKANEAVLTGGDTAASIHSGVLNGLLAETEGMIQRYRMQFPAVQVVLTGGDSSYLSGKVKSGIFAAPGLTLSGLNAILRHNQ